MARCALDISLQALEPVAAATWGQSTSAWVYGVSSAVIGLCSILVASTLAYMVWREPGLPFKRTALALGVLLSGGGVSFLLSTSAAPPQHLADTLLRALTAVAALIAAVTLPNLVPKA